MGKLATDLDSEALQHRNAYYMAMARGDYEQAMHATILMNKSVRPEKRVKENDGKDLKPLQRTSFTLKGDHDWESLIKTWCFRFAPLVQDVYARERERLLSSYDR